MTDRDRGDNQGDRNVRSLRSAIRRARLSQAERSDVIVDLREAEQARLELLFDELQPVFEEMPSDLEQFECALVPGDPPRLWIDMLVYAMMGPDKRTYRLVKDLRDGRHILHETLDVADMADQITDYLAHRIIERERAIESENTGFSQAKTHSGYSGLAVLLALACGFLLGLLTLFVIGAVVTAP